MDRRKGVAAHWLGQVERWRTSGLSRAAYCTREGLSASAFGYWVSKSNKQAQGGAAPPLTLVAGQPPWRAAPQSLDTGAMTLCTPDGWQLSFAQCPPVPWLRELLEGARR